MAPISRPLPKILALLAVASVATGAENRLTQRAPRSGPPGTYTGCLVDEASYATKTGLGRIQAPGTGVSQLVLSDVGRPGEAFALTGTGERGALVHLGMRVEITGTLLAGASRSAASAATLPQATETPASGAAGSTPRGQPAHEPGDSVAAADAAGSRASTLSNGGPAGRYASLSDLPRLDVVSMRVTGGRCADASAATRETGRHAGAVDPVRSRRPDYGHFRRP